MASLNLEERSSFLAISISADTVKLLTTMSSTKPVVLALQADDELADFLDYLDDYPTTVPFYF